MAREGSCVIISLVSFKIAANLLKAFYFDMRQDFSDSVFPLHQLKLEFDQEIKDGQK